MPPAYADCSLFTKVTAQRSFASKILHRPLNQTHQLIMKERGEGGGGLENDPAINYASERDVERRMAKMSQDSHQHNRTASFSNSNR